MLPPETLHLPFEPGPFRMAMGLQAIASDGLIELDDRYPAEMRLRRGLLDDNHAAVFGACPGSAAACGAVLRLVADVLPARYPAAFERHGNRLRDRITGEAFHVEAPGQDPLEIAGRLVQEDLCVLHPGPDGVRLVAAVLCFPSRWRLADKLGKHLTDVHRPVPLYADRLAAPVDRFIAHLRPGRLALRFNWSLADDPALFQPSGHGRTEHNAAITADNAGSAVFLRVERQTLGRLDPLDAVLFTIRTHVYPLERLEGRAAACLAAAVRALPEAMAAYKSLPPFRAAMLEYLDRRSA